MRFGYAQVGWKATFLMMSQLLFVLLVCKGELESDFLEDVSPTFGVSGM